MEYIKVSKSELAYHPKYGLGLLLDHYYMYSCEVYFPKYGIVDIVRDDEIFTFDKMYYLEIDETKDNGELAITSFEYSKETRSLIISIKNLNKSIYQFIFDGSYRYHCGGTGNYPLPRKYYNSLFTLLKKEYFALRKDFVFDKTLDYEHMLLLGGGMRISQMGLNYNF